MKKKIKLLALILILNFVNMIVPNEIFNCKAFAAQYMRDNFFDFSSGDPAYGGRDNAKNPGVNGCPSTLKADDTVVSTEDNGNLLLMNIIYSYDGTSSKETITRSTHTIRKINDIKEWEIGENDIVSDYPLNNKRDVTLKPLVREYSLNIEGDNSDKVEILEVTSRSALNNIDINYSGDTQYVISLKSQYASQYRVQGVNSVKIAGNDIGYEYEYADQDLMLTLDGTSIDKNSGPGEITIDVKIAEIRSIDNINVGDIIYPGDEIVTQDGNDATIDYYKGIGSSSYFCSSPVCNYYDVFSEDNTAFNGWKVMSVDVSNGNLNVKPQFEVNVVFESDDYNAIADYDEIFTTTDLNEQIKIGLEAQYGYSIIKCELLNDDGRVIEEVSYDSSSNSVTIPSIRELESKGINAADIHLKVTTEYDYPTFPGDWGDESISITIKLRNK